MCDLDAGCGGSCLRQRGWRRFFCLVWPRCREWGDLLASIERYDAGALVIWFVVACGSDANDANGRVVGAAGVGGVCVASAVVEGAGIVAVIVGAANYVEVAAVVAAEAGDDGVDDVGGVVEVAVAVVGG